jgi:serine/threonine protein kinase
MTAEFLTEIANHKLFSVRDSNIVNCYGISQDPVTKNYVMVMDYINGGNLRQYLQNQANELSFADKLFKLFLIAQGLDKIHEQGLVHRDFHSGNILIDNCMMSYITDLGLSKPVSEVDDGQIFGVVPYMAPEVLR